MNIFHFSCTFVVNVEYNLTTCHVMTQRMRILEVLK